MAAVSPRARRHQLSSRGHVPDGKRRRGGRGRAAARSRLRRLAGRGRIHHADARVRQYQRAHDHDRGKGRGPDPRGCGRKMMRFPGILLAAIASSAIRAPAAAADRCWSARSIMLIVPVAAGGGSDMVARVIATTLSERFGGIPVIVDNRGGAGAIIGTAMAAKATPDGYTLLVCDTAHTIQPTLQKLEYDPIKSFSLIASLVTGDSMLVSPASLPAKSIQEFIALAKQKPGQLVAGTAGAGSSGHMSLELFRVMAGIDLIMPHYKGAGAATIDLLGGTVHISNVTIQAA